MKNRDWRTMHAWKEHTLQVNGHEMAWFEIGIGPTLVCLHGSWDHLLYRPMGKLFAQKYRCVLYDQRGSGQSKLLENGADAMDIKKFTQDLDALRDHLGLDQIVLLGHSWGSGLGLLYAQAYPDCLSHLILVGPGPLNSEMRACYRANRDRMAYPTPPEEFAAIRRSYDEARSEGAVPHEIDKALIQVWSRIIFYSRETAEPFVNFYLNNGGYLRHAEPPTNFTHEMQLANADRITAPTLVVYGYQDYEPITQAYLIKEKIPQTEIAFLNECGHATWVDQPEEYFKVVDTFLSKGSVKRDG